MGIRVFMIASCGDVVSVVSVVDVEKQREMQKRMNSSLYGFDQEVRLRIMCFCDSEMRTFEVSRLWLAQFTSNRILTICAACQSKESKESEHVSSCDKFEPSGVCG
jgi:hypothetical protein